MAGSYHGLQEANVTLDSVPVSFPAWAGLLSPLGKKVLFCGVAKAWVNSLLSDDDVEFRRPGKGGSAGSGLFS